MANQSNRNITLIGENVQVSICNEPMQPMLGGEAMPCQEDDFHLKYGYTVRDLVTALYFPALYPEAVKFKVVLHPEYKFYEELFRDNKNREEEAEMKMKRWRSSVCSDYNENLCDSKEEDNDEDYQDEARAMDDDFNVDSLIEIFQNVMHLYQEVNQPPKQVLSTSSKDLSVEETKDHLNKDWGKVLQIYDNKRYYEIQKRWGNPSISNPKKNLSVLFFRLHAIPYSNDSEDDTDEEDDGPAAKRPRRQPCSFMIEKLIKEMERKLVKVRLSFFERRAEALAQLTRRHHMQAQAQGRYNKSYNLVKQHRQEIKNFTDEYAHKAQLLLGPLRDRIQSLKSLKDETEKFHKFYSDASKENDSAFYLNPDELDDLLSIEASISNYRNIYDNPKGS